MNIPGTSSGSDLPGIDLPNLDPAVLFSLLRADIPLLMLPVRLETRFYHNPDRLRIRVYPDQIHVNNHQPALSETEARLGQQFWEIAWHSSWDKASRVFGRLADTLGVWRAAWVTEATAPTNLSAIGKGQPVFPPLDTDWVPGAPAQLALLPNRWFAVGMLHGEAIFVEYGELIPDALRFAPFQMQSGEDVERWMIDFGVARRTGMALEIRLNGNKQAVATQGLDELIILGARLGDPAVLAQKLEDTLRGHYYTRGLDFVPQGTPTNNTESVRSPWQWNTADPTDVFQRAWQPNSAVAGSFRERFAKALGLDMDGIVARAAHGDLSDIPAMEAMNRILWYTTWGEYLRFVLHDGEKAPLSDESIDWVRDWFIGHVRGGAVYPAFQIGSIPYGVLPVQIEPVPQDAHTNDEFLQSVLSNLRAGWERSLPDVPHLDPTATASATDAEVTTDLEAANDNLISLLSSHPHPVRFFTRNLYNLRDPSLDLDILILLGIIADPVDRLEALTDQLLIDTDAVDPTWSDNIELDLRNPFDSLASQQAYFQDLMADIDARLDQANQDITDFGDTLGGIIPPDLIDDLNDLVAARDAVQKAKDTATLIQSLLDAHADRVYPVNSVGLPPLMDVVDEATPNPEHFYFLYQEAMTEWGDLPLVQAADATGGATAAVYLAWLHDYALGTVTGTGPDGLPDPAPLLFQLIKRAIDRANAWDNVPLVNLGGFLKDIQISSQLTTPAARVNATRRLMSDEGRLAATTHLLNQALKSPAKDPTRRAIAGVPRTLFKTASAQLSEYQRITQKTSPEVTQMISALNAWAQVPGGTSPLPGSGGVIGVPIKSGGRAAQLAGSISTLSGLTPEELGLRMTETLGLAMHRLDAWITAYAEQRVDSLRSKNPAGIQIGGFGWVENLRPDTAGTGPSQGYIHAPSMTHAAAAAVLRSGYSAYSDGTSTSPLSVDLRSDRVRVASWMMDGVRQGQRINDLLGYRFERYLHDQHLDIWIAPAREAVASHGTTELSGSSSLVTVDGLALLELWDEGAGPLEDVIVAPVDADGTVHDFDELKPALHHLVWITDAMADLALAESVHALVQGDYERASAVQNAAALGDIPPPEVRSILTPNSGMTITHRIVLVPQSTGSPWKHGGLSIRSQLEPGLEAWVSAIVGEPNRVWYQVRGGPDDPADVLSLADLPLSALDAVYLAPTSNSLAGSGLGALIALAYRRRHATPQHEIPDITIDANIPVGDDQLSLSEFFLLANSVRQTLSGARAATGSDFLLGASEDSEEAGGARVGELIGRAANLVSDFDHAIQAVGDESIPLDQSLLRLSYFNLPQAIPASSQVDLLAAQAESVLAAVGDRLEQAQNTINHARENAANWSAGQLLRQARDVIATVLGRDFPVMVRFEMPLPSEAIREEAAVTSDDARPVIGWLLKMARVRPELTSLREMITAAEAFQDRSLFPFAVAQIPYVVGEPWAGLARPNTEGQDRLSLVLTTNGSFSDQAATVSGLVIDQWIERIPTDYEMTGLTFHFDAPTSRPPQVLLLTVPPVGADWSFDLVLDTVREAFALARLRAVAPETLDEYGHHLPAVYLTSNLDTIGATNGE